MSKFTSRKQIRQEKEYLYRKKMEMDKREREQKKKRIQQARDNNTAIPSDLRGEALQLLRSNEFDDAGGEGVTSSIDDEYRWVGVNDPNILITTSHNPSSSLKQFIKEFSLLLPNATRINRGNANLNSLIKSSRDNGVTDFIVLTEVRGKPTGLQICHLPYGPTAYFEISDVIMRSEIPGVRNMSEAYPNLIFHNFGTHHVPQRIKTILQALFPVPKEGSKRVMGFANLDDHIAFRHYTYTKPDHKTVDLEEAGPRFTLKPYKIIRGTLDEESTAEKEWQPGKHTNTAGKVQWLSRMKE